MLFFANEHFFLICEWNISYYLRNIAKLTSLLDVNNLERLVNRFVTSVEIITHFISWHFWSIAHLKGSSLKPCHSHLLAVTLQLQHISLFPINYFFLLYGLFIIAYCHSTATASFCISVTSKLV